MDAVKLLGQLLGNNSMGSNILGSLLGGGKGALPQGSGGLGGLLGSLLAGTQGGGSAGGGGLADLLGGLLGAGATDQGLASSGAAPEAPAPAEDQQTEAELLIRAMCKAAKSDGKFDAEEREKIFSRLGEMGEEETEFIRGALAEPLDSPAFAREVPPQLAQKVYAFSVMAIKLDEQSEARYLGELAQALALDPNTCNEINAQLGAPASSDRLPRCRRTAGHGRGGRITPSAA